MLPTASEVAVLVAVVVAEVVAVLLNVVLGLVIRQSTKVPSSNPARAALSTWITSPQLLSPSATGLAMSRPVTLHRIDAFCGISVMRPCRCALEPIV